MSNYVIVTDSSCDLSAQVVEQLQLRVVPLSVFVDDKRYTNYPDWREISAKEFYDAMRAGAKTTTSAANVEQFRLLLYHLLSNALKFTPAGGKVQLELKGGKSGDPILLSVSDNGCGIRAEDMETLFDRFRHADAHPAPHGLGLGLPLCRAIARRHGGTLVVNSTAGEGTTVTVSLQRVKPQSVTISDVRKNYETKGSLFFSSDGYNYALTQLADALPYKAFDPRHLE